MKIYPFRYQAMGLRALLLCYLVWNSQLFSGSPGKGLQVSHSSLGLRKAVEHRSPACLDSPMTSFKGIKGKNQNWLV